MEMTKEFAESQLMLHKIEVSRWSKIVRSVSNATPKKRKTKLEKEIEVSANIDKHFLKRTKRA